MDIIQEVYNEQSSLGPQDRVTLVTHVAKKPTLIRIAAVSLL